MEKYLTLKVPGYEEIEAPEGIQTGGLSSTGGNAIQSVITLLLILAVVVAMFMLVWSGIRWTMSGGDKQKIQTARQHIIWTIIGLVIVFASFLVINVIGAVFGVELLNFDIGS